MNVAGFSKSSARLSSPMTVFKLNTFCIVTGASRGLGREIALQLVQGWIREGAQCDVVLVARSKEGLEKVREEITSAARGGGVERITIHLVVADLGDLGSLSAVFSQCSEKADLAKHNQFMIVHNAGTTGDITKPMSEQIDPTSIQEQVGLNFTSMSVLTSLFLSKFTQGEKKVIQISSLLTKVFISSFGMYSATRAARNALTGVLAVENPDVRFLTYTPGPCMTDMGQYIAENSFSSSVRETTVKMRESGEALSCQQSISKLMKILMEDTYDNAAVIDYYD